MKIRNPDLSSKDWELCCSYVKDMEQKGLSAYELWELELEVWAANPDRQPRKSTVTKLRLRFPIRVERRHTENSCFNTIDKSAWPLQSPTRRG